MKIRSLIALFLMSGNLCYINDVFAEGLNNQMPGGLDAKSRAKIGSFKAEQEALGNSMSGIGKTATANCGSVSVGNVRTNGLNAPREVTTIVTGDIININSGNCK